MQVVNSPVPLRPAATVVVLRDGPNGVEVAMLQRHSETPAAGGAWVFPGGSVDADDAAPTFVSTDREADRRRRDRLQTPEATSYYVAALRELFEEAGVLLVRETIDVDQQTRWRLAIATGESTFTALLEREGLHLDLDALEYIAHWRTPEGRPRRYDTRFFLAALPVGGSIACDGHEIVAHVWCRPADALARYHAGEWHLLLPTHTLLSQLHSFTTVTEAQSFWRGQPRPTMTQPVEVLRDGRLVAELPT